MCVPGSSPEGVDVRDYVDVGVTNMAVAIGLTLQDGNTYFVTIRGELFIFTYKAPFCHSVTVTELSSF